MYPERPIALPILLLPERPGRTAGTAIPCRVHRTGSRGGQFLLRAAAFHFSVQPAYGRRLAGGTMGYIADNAARKLGKRRAMATRRPGRS